MLQEPTTSDYDLRFNLLGFPVRVAWGFWLVAAILGWNWSGSIDDAWAGDSPGTAVLLIIWIAAVLVSIVVHELGHSLAMRWYGMESRIVLYHFGGLAIPESFTSWRGARARRVGPHEEIVISAAGPAIQLALGLAVWGIAMAMGIYVQETAWVNWLLGTNFGAEATLPRSAALYAVLSSLIWTSVMWAVLNLSPILPLDGGRIALNVFRLTNNGRPDYNAHLLSVVAAALLGVWFLSVGQLGGMMFLMFAATNWQAMQYSSRGW
jgi:stage IV sporulation protein FB